jgi:outer membrane protein OmpA-like peptidoglycan-associated protein
MPSPYAPRLWQWLAGLWSGLLLFSGASSHAYEDSSFHAHPGNGSYRHSYSYPQSLHTVSPAQNAPAYGTPFGLSKSAAGALTGALLGAASGAIIGSAKGDAGPGAAIGAGIGAVSGYLVGRQIDTRDQALTAQEQLLEQQRQEIARNRALLEELQRRHLAARETERGVVVHLPDVLFEFNSARLTPEARSTVFYIADVLNRQAAGRHISVEGHADAIGSESYNQALSQSRAEAVVRELRNAGVDPSRVVARGYGEKYPVAPNTHADGSDNPAGRAKNRRVEVVIEN